MFPLLHIELLGKFRLSYGDEIIPVASMRLQSFFAFLLLCVEKPQSRRTLAEQFFPNHPHLAAVALLDELIQQAQAILPEAVQPLSVTPELVRWQPDAAYILDVTTFEDMLHQANSTTDPGDACNLLTTALELYTGDLLPACQEDWLRGERDRLRQLYIRALERLTGLLEKQGDYHNAVQHVRRLYHLDSAHAPTYRHLVHLYVLGSGRASDLRTLVERLETTRRNRGALVLISGEAGIGKSSLALVCAEQAHAQGITVAVGHCYERGVTPPFLPWRELIATLSLTAPELETLPEPFGSGPVAPSIHELIQRVASQLYRLAAKQPLLLILDDLHWADQDSLDLLEYVTRNLDRTPLLLIGAYRSEELQQRRPLYSYLSVLRHNRPVEFIAMTPLDIDGTMRLVEGYHGACTAQLGRYLHERTEGHPLFLVELLNNLMERDLLAKDALGLWLKPIHDVPVPHLLQQVITERVERLGAQAETFLEVAAVVGVVWHLALVEGILEWPEDEILTTVEQLLAAHIVEAVNEEHEQYRFAHGLIQEVFYKRQFARRRRQFHARIAALQEQHLLSGAELHTIAKDEQYSVLAYHSHRAEQWDKSYQYGVSAGDSARRHYANHSALEFYQQALDAAYKMSVPLAPAMLIGLYEKLGEMYAVLNRKDEATLAFAQMVERARAADDKRAEARGLFHLGVAQEVALQLDDAAATRQVALQLVENIDDPHLHALKHLHVGRIYLAIGKPEQALLPLGQLEHYARMIPDPALLARSLRYQGYITVFRARYAEAIDLAAEGIKIATAAHDMVSLLGFVWVMGVAHVEQGYYEEGSRHLQYGLEQTDALGEDHYYTARLLNTMGYLYSEVGDFASALQWHERALELNRSEAVSYPHAISYTLLDLATNHLYAGDSDRSLSYLQQFESVQKHLYSAEFRYLNRLQLLQAELALARGEYDRALAYATEAGKLAAAKNMPKNLIKSQLRSGSALLGMGHPNEAAPRLKEAVILADQILHGSLRWQARLLLAQAQTLTDQLEIHLYQDALDQVNAIADRLGDERLRTCFLTSPLVLELQINAKSALKNPTRRQNKALPQKDQYAAGLTNREVEVLRLIAQGATDRQIADQLHVSVRTVNSHVMNILNKTGCDNRTAAALYARDSRLI